MAALCAVFERGRFDIWSWMVSALDASASEREGTRVVDSERGKVGSVEEVLVK